MPVLLNTTIYGGNALGCTYAVDSLVASIIIHLAYHRKRGNDVSLAYKEIPPRACLTYTIVLDELLTV